MSNQLQVALQSFWIKHRLSLPTGAERCSQYNMRHGTVYDVRTLCCLDVPSISARVFCTGNEAAASATEEELIQLLKEDVHYSFITEGMVSDFAFHIKGPVLQICLLIRAQAPQFYEPETNNPADWN